MLKKIISIKNVGKFRNYSASGDVELKKLSLIHGENGRGKTTKCAILRSLADGDPLHIAERRTVDAAEQAEITILTDVGTHNFVANAWTSRYEPIVIFDGTYIAENIYSGDFVELDHKKKLYRVTIGKRGVELATKVSALDARSRELASKIGESSTRLERHVPAGMTVEQFVALPADADIDSKIKAKKNAIKTLSDAETIKLKPSLAKLTAPTYPTDVVALLSRTLDDVAKDAEAKIAVHIRAHELERLGPAWMAQGLPFVQNDECPFCGLNVRGSGLINAYRSFFSASYNAFKAEIAATSSKFATAFSEKALASLKTTLIQNQAGLDFWKNYAEAALPELSYEGIIEPCFEGMIEQIGGLLKRKSDVPLDALGIAEPSQAAIDALDRLEEQIASYNSAVDATNAVISKVKQSSQSGNMDALRNELLHLQAQKNRHAADVSIACDAHLKLAQDKADVEKEKAAAKAELDAYTKNVLENSENAINHLLDRFGAGFRITGTQQQFVGGSASSTFRLSINGVPVELGNSRTERGTPCFRTAMSAGDRTTLALAFFLVQVQQRPDLHDLTVIFDDPLTSHDRFRQQVTRDQIRTIEKKAKQVIVLSHEPSFLELIADGYDPANLKLLCLARDGNSNSALRPWDMKGELSTGFYKDLATLRSFYCGDTDDLRAVARCIRPVLETHLRTLYPGEFLPNEWFGQMLEKVRNAAAGGPLDGAKPMLPDLESLNDYTKRYHHDDNSVRAGTANILDTELLPFVTLALKVTNRL